MTIFLALLFPASPAQGDVILLRNGDRLTGQLVSYDGSHLVLRTDYAGAVKLPAGLISGVTTDTVVTVRFKRNGYYTGRLHTPYSGWLVLISDDPPSSAPIDFASIAEMHPGAKVPRGFKWSGRVNLGATKRSGNTDTSSIHVDGEVVGRSRKDRITFRGQVNRETEDGRKSEDDFQAFVKHDHFVTRKTFFYTGLKLEREEPENLSLRTTVGTGIGYQVFESPTSNLSVEAGPSYVNENFITGPDNDFFAGRWAVAFDRYIWRKYVQVFHRNEGILNLEDAADVLIQSSTGFRILLGDGFNVTTQVDIDWDNEPAAGAKSTDTKYLLTLGYAW